MRWIPDAQSSPHYWASTLGGHAAIGAGMAALCLAVGLPALPIALVGYAGWEIAQAAIYGPLTKALRWDALLDWLAVAAGAMFALRLHDGDALSSAIIAGALGVVFAAGYLRRR